MKNSEPSEQEKQDALNALTQHMRAVKQRRDAVSADELQAALDTIANALESHWSTGGGTRLRRFIWSLWNGWHLVNLFDLCSGLDYLLGDAVIVVFRAQMVGALTENHKRSVLHQSGEFARWEQASAETPEGEDVLYPPFPLDTDDLRRLALSSAQLAKRLDAVRRAEFSRMDREERMTG